MDDADDYESWSAAASVHPELAAHQIARLKNPWWNPTWRDLVPVAADWAPSPPVPVSVSVDWGSRRTRTRSASFPGRIRTRHPKSCVAASSPATPLDFGSASASGCGSEDASSSPEKPTPMAVSEEEGEDMRRIVDDDVSGYVAQVAGLDRSSPLGFGISAAKDIRRSGKKKTMCELQVEEQLLLEEKIMLQKEVEVGRKAYKTLQAENKRLKSQKSERRGPTWCAASVVVSPKRSSRNGFLLPDLKNGFLLPDLNEPLPDISD